MSEIVATWLLFTHSPSQQLSHLIKTLRRNGWRVSERGGIYSCLVDGQRKKAETVDEIIAQIDSGATASVKIERNQTEVRIKKNADKGPSQELTNVFFSSWESEFRPPRDGWNGFDRAAATTEYVNAVSTAVEELKPNYGYGTFPEYTDPAAVPTYDDVLDGRVRGTFWLNVFGAKSIDRLGRDRIESAPAWRVEELANGHLLVVTSDNPVDPSEEWANATEAVAAHLELDE